MFKRNQYKIVPVAPTEEEHSFVALVEEYNQPGMLEKMNTFKKDVKSWKTAQMKKEDRKMQKFMGGCILTALIIIL